MEDPTRIVVATTFENRAPYVSEVEILFRTLATYGGELARARRIACCVGAPDPFVVEVLGDLDVEVREVAPFDERCPHANKLAMLELAVDGDLVLALDTDIAIAGDITPWLTTSAISAKIADNETVGLANWPSLFAARGVELPPARYLNDHAGRETIPYFNSGVVAVPSAMCAPLLAEWGDAVRWLLDSYDELPALFTDRSFFTDQFAFALAIARLDAPVRALPLELNFPTHIPLHPTVGPEHVSPLLVHHHHLLEADGQLKPCAYRAPNAAIERINVELRRDPDAAAAPPEAAAPAPAPGQERFDNQQFWNERYTTNMELGSGIGSRGDLLTRKRAMLQGVLDVDQPVSFLDVGCGDIEIVRELVYAGAYTGIDISDVVVTRNAQLMPHWDFLHGDFIALAAEHDLAADLVVCLDVLIHQHDADFYERFVRALVGATRKVGIVAAFDALPTGAFASAITAFHGPITELLIACGATDIEQIDEYRGTAVVRFTPPAG